MGDFQSKGWVRFAVDQSVLDWIDHVAPHAKQLAKNTELQEKWLRSGQTWFVGADVLGNNAQGSVNGSAPLSGQAAGFAQDLMGSQDFDWGIGQVSVCYPGYPKQDEGEPNPAFRYRLLRDNAHLDGLKAVGAQKHRFMQEYHGFIFGIPLQSMPSSASPFVIWEGSHLVFQDMLKKAFQSKDPEDWRHTDLTDIYKATRAKIFETCKRVEIAVDKGETYIAHRFSLHGMGKWDAEGEFPEGRMIAYLRPFWQSDLTNWLEL